MSNANFGAFDRDIFCFSAMVRASSLAGGVGLTSQSNAFNIKFDAGGNLRVDFGTAGAGLPYSLITTATYSATTWYHVYIIWDGQNATADDRMRVFVDGTEVTSFSSRSNPPQASLHNSSSDIRLGADDDLTYHDGQIYQPAFFSGAIPAASSLFANGKPKNVKALSGLHSTLQTRSNIILENDAVLATNWTNNNTVIKSTEIPS